MTIYPQCSATEEDGPQFGAILSNHILPASRVILRESNRRMSTIQKIARETAGFHMESARRHGVNTQRGLAHFRAAKAYREADSKLLEFFDQGQDPQGGGQNLDPKAQCEAHGEAVKFHKKMAEKHGLDTDQGHAHVALMEKHMDAMRGLKQKSKQQKQQKPAAQGPKGRQQPQMPKIPAKSQMKNPDIRQNKPPIELRPKESGGKNQNYVAQRYDQSHPEGFRKDYGK